MKPTSKLDQLVRVRKLDPKFGPWGIGVMSLGTFGAVAVQVFAMLTKGNPLNPLFIVFASIYLPGAFVVAASYGFQKGSKVMLYMRICRLLIAFSLVGAILITTRNI